ncbi:cell cycle regulator of non-homologous end joining isoform X1 [Elephas maximus indicus]|uniref:cell cycle regulator of non-homologous end joining isoform X1 n=2 Tax=Elephas maximus indicus TaxID=99487 RepID=UPI002115E3F2|nr:cell cycle regulator of non-homologous end joining isoform X1 [Elephas maximus indicus]XP_049749338.1 cell cycle regulator of non-homologous end joining isoform X1 [Elephas maximus indicus]XP_049749339.1 cell cycle regulator of non-homologous end joining isoform X1 [Elephas maximus indicus]XP_049749340.1 cell cycle regulator of non-homologous end joining isoform X1 [Elephas maximus indicus]XP_049749341.1 cell cycle regulator of non-homologous end joining isoform X1 [Elephas maximus indicus]
METMQSANKNRILPAWMTAQVVEKPVVPAKDPKRRRTAVAKASAARLPAMRTVYCMNEAEVVDAALAVLIEGRKREKSLEQKAPAKADKLELSPRSLRSPWSPGGRSEDKDNGEDSLPPSLGPSQELGGSDSTHSESQKEEEDALKYVREIFFS